MDFQEEQKDWQAEFEREMLYTFGLKWKGRYEQIERLFGGLPDCLFNLRMFNSRVKNGPALVKCPPSDHYYHRVKVLSKNKVIRKLKPFTPSVEDELQSLTVAKLREVCAAIGVSVAAHAKKGQIVKALKDHPDINLHIKPQQQTDIYEFLPLPGQTLSNPGDHGPESLTVPSETTPGLYYQIDLKELTCTCPDWEKRHKEAPRESPARLCKHLLKQLAEQPNLMTPMMWGHGLTMTDRYDHGRGMPGHSAVYGKHGENMPTFYIIEPGEDGWINFLIDDNRYGYNVDAKRWARGEKPEISRHLLSVIKKLGLQPLSHGSPTEEDRRPPRPEGGRKKKAAPASRRRSKPASLGCGSLLFMFFIVVCVVSAFKQCTGQ